MTRIARRINVLGRLDATDADGAPMPVRGGLPRKLLYLLVAARHRSMPLDSIIDGLWEMEAPATARTAVHVNVSRLRDDIGDGAIVTNQAGYQLSEEVITDLDEFEQRAAAGRTALREGRAHEGTVLLREVLGLWRGTPFEGAELEEALVEERLRLEELRTRCIADRIECDLMLGRHLDVVTQLRELCAEQPLNERHWSLLMLALYRSGSQSDALRAYTEAETILAQELGIDPGPEIKNLERQILLQDPELLGPAFQPSHRPRHNLKVFPTPTLGREQELAEISSDVVRHRMVTLVGPAGIGKTRMAIEAAHGIVDSMPDGAWMVDLDSAETGEHVLRLMQDALRIVDQVGVEPSVAIVDSLRARKMLLMLDNCERIASTVAALAQDILASCPRITILSTSRRPLGVPEEVVRRVPPLAIPREGSDPSESPAVQLFLERAAAAAPHTSLAGDLDQVAALCERLDGLPLAIELAASQVAALSIRQIRARLDGRLDTLVAPGVRSDSRGGSLVAAIGASLDLLDPTTRDTLAMLTVFRGPFTLEAATSVCGRDVVDDLLTLVRTSLLDAPPPANGEIRYRLLDTIRQFAATDLDEKATAQLRTRHAAYMVEYAEALRNGVTGPNGPTWVRRGLQDRPNLIAALEWALNEGDRNTIVDIVWSIRWMTTRIGRMAEIRSWLDQILEDRSGLTPVNEMRAVTSRATIALLSGSSQDGLEFAEEGLRLAEAVGDDHEVAAMKVVSAGLLTFAGRHEAVPETVDEGLQIAERVGDRWSLGWAYSFRGTMLRMTGQLGDAQTALQLALESFETIGDEHGRVFPLINLGHIAIMRDDLDTALARARAGLAAAKSTGDPIFTASATAFVAEVLLTRKETRGVRDLLLEAARLLSDSTNAVIMQSVAETGAWLMTEEGNLVRAAYLAGIGEGIRRQSGLILSDHVMARHAAVLEEAREALGTQAERHAEAGRGLDSQAAQQAIVHTLSIAD